MGLSALHSQTNTATFLVLTFGLNIVYVCARIYMCVCVCARVCVCMCRYMYICIYVDK